MLSHDEILAAFPPAPRTLHFRELARRLGVDRPAQSDLWLVVGEMVDAGLVERYQGRHYGRPVEVVVALGTLTVHPRGFGFVALEGGGDDVYVDGRDLGGATHRDRVRVRIVPRKNGRLSGEVLDVVERGTHTFVAQVRESRVARWLVPRDGRLPERVAVAKDGADDGLRDGDVVAAAFVDRDVDDDFRPPTARIVRVFGRDGQVARETDLAVYDLGLPVDHTPAAEAEAAAAPEVIPAAEIARRRDLRDLALLTVDPETARDFDDAVHARPLADGGWRFTVAVADVAHYVRSGGALDAEARQRGFSVYLPDRVLPMLPHRLSSGLCSLRPDEDRLAMVVEFDVGPDGRRSAAVCSEAVIRSHARLTYDEVAAMLGLGGRASAEGLPEHEVLRPVLDALLAGTRALRRHRRRRGRLDLDTAEPQIDFAPDGQVAGIIARRRHEAHRLVEEAMVAANEAVALMFVEAEHPAVFRVHDTPSSEGLTRLRAQAELMGAPLVAGADDVADLDAWIETIEEHPDRGLLNLLLLRAMARADYRADCSPHFGLGAPAYLHFTSPIRRYADLVVHRLIKAALTDRPLPGAAELEDVAREINRRERVTVDGERQVMALYKCLAMQGKIGLVTEGVVMGVSSTGLFVHLEDQHVDGFVRLDRMAGYRFQITRDQSALVDQASGTRYQLGQRLRVRLVDVSLRQRRMEFELVRPPARPAGFDRKGRKDRSRAFRPGRRRR